MLPLHQTVFLFTLFIGLLSFVFQKALESPECHYHRMAARRLLYLNKSLDEVYLYSHMCGPGELDLSVNMTGPDSVWVATGFWRFLRFAPSREQSRLFCRLDAYSITTPGDAVVELLTFFIGEPNHFEGTVSPHERRLYAYRLQCPTTISVHRIRR